MRGLLVFDKLNDVLFVDCDDEYTSYVKKHAVSMGLMDQADDYPDENVIVQLFSPIISSQRVLIEDMNNPYTSVTCEDGTLFVFKQFGDQIHIAVNGDGTESEAFLSKKLLVFQRLVGFLYGPIIDGIRGESSCIRQQTRNTLYQLLLTWEDLYWKEQAFLLEATERLNVNQNVNATCLQLLQTVSERMQGAGEKNTEHAILVVNSKLLALYSRHNAAELQPADLLTIILLIQGIIPADDVEASASKRENRSSFVSSSGGRSSVYTSEDNLKDETKQFTNSSSSNSEFVDSVSAPIGKLSEKLGELKIDRLCEKGEDEEEELLCKINVVEEEDSELEFYSPSASPLPREFSPIESPLASEDVPRPSQLTRASTLPKENIPRLSHVKRRSSPRASASPIEERRHSTQQKTTIDAHFTQSEPPTQRSPPASPTNCRRSNSSPQEHHLRHTVFLSTPVSQFTPHQLYCVQVHPGIVLVVITQAGQAHMSGHICKTLSIMREIRDGGSSRLLQQHGQSVFDILDSKIDKLTSAFKKIKATVDAEGVLVDIRKRWADAKSHNLLLYLESGGRCIPTPRLESILSTLFNKLCRLFQVLFLSHQETPHAVYKTVVSAKQFLRKNLQDFKEYLLVKSHHNIAMTNYMADYPGLVHFIYVDRMNNLITAPSIYDDGHENTNGHVTNDWLKRKVWEQVEWIYAKVHEGVTTIVATNGDFKYSYFLWFEDSCGRPLEPQQPCSVDARISPGIMYRNFYMHLVQRCFPSSAAGSVHCYELFTMHVGLVPPSYILQQSRQLSSALWETSSEAFTPISLL